jgi:hypothetical protein
LCGVKVYFYPLGRRFFTTTTTTTTTTRPLSLVFLSGLGIPCGFCVSADHVRPPRRIIRPMDNPNPAAAAIQQITFLLQLDCWCYYYDTNDVCWRAVYRPVPSDRDGRAGPSRQ